MSIFFVLKNLAATFLACDIYAWKYRFLFISALFLAPLSNLQSKDSLNKTFSSSEGTNEWIIEEGFASDETDVDVMISLVSSVSPRCFGSFDGSIIVTANGGVAPYMYALNGGVFGVDSSFLDLDEGDYMVTVMDQEGSESSLTVSLESPPILENTFLAKEDNTCFGAFQGMIEVIGSGGTSALGYSYSINGGPNQSTGLFTGLSNGFYVVTVIDDNECEAQVTAEILSPPDILITVTDITDVSCKGDSDGSAVVFTSGGVGNYEYAIDDGDFGTDNMFSNLEEGLHTLYVRDGNDCIESSTFLVSAPELLSIDPNITNLICNGDSTGAVSIDVIGGIAPYEYFFDSNSADTIGSYSNLIARMYVIEVVDFNGCSVIDSIEVGEPPLLQIDVVTNVPATCGGEGFAIFNTISASGDVMYFVDSLWIESDTFSSVFGEYTIFVFDSLGCSASLDFEIEQLSNLMISVDTIFDVSCFGGTDGSVQLSSEGGVGPVGYSLDGEVAVSTPSYDSLAAGNYIISVIDSLGCIDNQLITVLQPDSLIFQLEEIVDVACFGESTGSIQGLITGGVGDYTVQATNGVFAVDSNRLVIDSLAEGALYISLQDEQGCILTDTLQVMGNPVLQLSIDSVESVNCVEGTMGYMALSGSGGALPYTYVSNGVSTDGDFEGLMADDYTITVVDSFGCSASTEVTIGKLGSLQIEGTGFSDVSCYGGDDGLYVLNIPNFIGGIDWSINGVANLDSNFNNLQSGAYTLSARDSFGCAVTLDIEIDEPDELIASIVHFHGGTGTDGSITVAAQGGTEPYTYSIDGQVTFQDSAIFNNLIEGSYVIVVSDANGCQVTVDQVITDVNSPIFNTLKIGPNPANVMVEITYSNGDLRKMKKQIVDANGRIIPVSITDINQHSVAIDIKDLPNGLYFTIIYDGDIIAVERFIKI